jgi:NADH:ubiquinone oxidoreductase subunit 6 (subunit J)
VDARQAWRAIERRGLVGGSALALSVAACYGTLGAVAALSALGVTLAVDTRMWAAAIVLFAAIAAIGVGLGARAHRSAAPLAPAFAGVALVGYAMFGHYHRAIEVAGFALLGAAVLWDYRLRSRAQCGTAGAGETTGS